MAYFNAWEDTVHPLREHCEGERRACFRRGKTMGKKEKGKLVIGGDAKRT